MIQELNFNSRYQNLNSDTFYNYEPTKLSQYQNYLYKRALYGLKGLPAEEIQTMCKAKRQRVHNVFLKAQKVINIYKQNKTNLLTNTIFSKLFPNSKISKYLSDNSLTDESYTNTLNFKDLDITKDDLISLFIEKKVLPSNFYSLVTDPNSLPRLKG
jgi:hypothetical protein